MTNLSRAVFPQPECLQRRSARRSAENSVLENEVVVNLSVVHAELIATFKRAQVDAAYKFGLIKAVEKKGLKAVQAAIDTAAKAAKRRDSYAKKLNVMGGESQGLSGAENLAWLAKSPLPTQVSVAGDNSAIEANKSPKRSP